MGVTRFLAKGENGLFSVILRFPARAVFQWPVLDMAEKQWCKSEEEKKSAKKINTRIVNSAGKEGKMFVEYFSVLGGVCQ